ncbi:PIN domain-containing protein [Chelativorans sp. EGI FJ00035]|uniref:PIN domain-containing protein n=1 Tax=Chelativorans salis TaxID=2978478 RepID=A0ABT2LL17_9HYPH|nr:PIN domain-containing protein [Chelativorans sp. EGI FJ00035]MCT7373879.1 PIN domain-containing protein [Chelativorans sp. EGI FJ00035]
MILLDTNVISEILARKPNQVAFHWLNKQEDTNLFLSSITLAELYFGANLVAEGERRQNLLESIARIQGAFAGRVLPFGDVPAEIYGRAATVRQTAGRRMETKDAMIAAVSPTVPPSPRATCAISKALT